VRDVFQGIICLGLFKSTQANRAPSLLDQEPHSVTIATIFCDAFQTCHFLNSISLNPSVTENHGGPVMEPVFGSNS